VQRNGATLLIAILGSRNLWGDTRRLLEYGFDNYETLKSASSITTHGPVTQVAARPERGSLIALPQDGDHSFSAPDGYIVQLGAFRERERAEFLARQFSRRGLQIFLETVTPTKGEVTYRVRMGPYGARTEAEEIAKEILQTSGHPAIILPADPPLEPAGRPS
jgi:cell division septation protein DedD